MKLFVPLVLLAFASRDTSAQDLPKFMGRQVTIIEPEIEDEFFPKGPATVCLEGPPQRQCYTAPREYGRYSTVAVIQLGKGESALFFSTESGGVSGWSVHFALIRPGAGKDLEDFLHPDQASDMNQHLFWNDASISDAPIFVTAEPVWGPDESHWGEHRYTISAYALKRSSNYYDLEDRYMTVRAYKPKPEADVDILAAEKQEIIARLKRVKASRH